MDRETALRESFNKLFKEFDFEKTQKMFEVFGFTYAIPFGDIHVPSVLDIEANFLQLVQSALRMSYLDEYWLESGHLKVGFKSDKVYCEVIFMKQSKYFK